MKTQKLGVALSTLFLISSLVIPSVVFAQEPQDADITITSDTVLFYEGYNSTGTDPNGVTFTGVTASPSAQETTLNITADSWTDDQFLGVLDLDDANTWSVTSQQSGTCDDATSTDVFTPTSFELVTSAQEWASAPTIDESAPGTGSFATTIVSSGTDANDIAYTLVTGSGYSTFTNGDVTAPENVPDSFGFGTGDTWTDATSAVTILNNATDDGEVGLFGTGLNYDVGVPGGTAADTYTCVVTHTLNCTGC